MTLKYLMLSVYQHDFTPGGGGGNLSFQDTGLCHSNRKSTTHKSGETPQKHTHKSGEFAENYTHKSGNAKTVHQYMNFYKNYTHKSRKC